MLYFHDLRPTPEGTAPPTIPAELREEMDRRYNVLVMGLETPAGPPVDVASFVVVGPQRGDRCALIVDRSHLDGTPEENLASIQRTAPAEWEVFCRTGTV